MCSTGLHHYIALPVFKLFGSYDCIKRWLLCCDHQTLFDIFLHKQTYLVFELRSILQLAS